MAQLEITDYHAKYFAHELPDLVMLMDESHRYRASAGIRAINELKPILWLELTATPFVEGTKGAVPFKNVIVDYSVKEPPADYRVSPEDKSNMSKYVFGGFKRCLYTEQKFGSEAERVLAVILERDAEKWFRPAKGQFQIFYKQGADHLEYQPDFVVETKDAIYMLEPKASNQMADPVVVAKKEAAIRWCKNASDYALANGGKPWRYVLIPHNAIAVNMTLDGLAGQFGE